MHTYLKLTLEYNYSLFMIPYLSYFSKIPNYILNNCTTYPLHNVRVKRTNRTKLILWLFTSFANVLKCFGDAKRHFVGITILT